MTSTTSTLEGSSTLFDIILDMDYFLDFSRLLTVGAITDD